MKGSHRPSNTIPHVSAYGFTRNCPVEFSGDEEYEARRAAAVANLEADPRFAQCRKCQEQGEPRCETSCPMDPARQEAEERRKAWRARNAEQRRKTALRKAKQRRAEQRRETAKRTEYVSPFARVRP